MLPKKRVYKICSYNVKTQIYKDCFVWIVGRKLLKPKLHQELLPFYLPLDRAVPVLVP